MIQVKDCHGIRSDEHNEPNGVESISVEEDKFVLF